jgi:hypothetical protein
VIFPRMDHRPAFLPEKPDQRLDRWDNGLKTRNLISEGLTKSSRLDEVALHVNHGESRPFRINAKIIRLRLNRDHGSMPRHMLPNRGAVCLRARNGVGDFAFGHHGDPVCELQNLIQIFREKEDRSAAIPLFNDLRPYLSD